MPNWQRQRTTSEDIVEHLRSDPQLWHDSQADPDLLSQAQQLLIALKLKIKYLEWAQTMAVPCRELGISQKKPLKLDELLSQN